MKKADLRIKTLEHDLKKIRERGAGDDDSDDDDDLNETEGIEAEIKELKQANAERQAKLDAYEKNKKWNVDNMFSVKEERTVINPTAGQKTYTDSGFVEPKDPDLKPKAKVVAAPPAKEKAAPTGPKPAPKASPAKPAPMPEHNPPPVEVGAFETYHQFTEKYAETVELFMAIPDLQGSKEFLLKFADILLQENASNYLLLASLEDEMNGHREKMKRTARQSQIISNIAELAKSLKTHPGNVIMPFFNRLEQREHLEEFLKGCKEFQEKIIKRAIVKKQEIDEQRAAEAAAAGGQSTDLHDIPREERLGPGGLDPLEVIETLPEEMVKAFESRNVENLKAALMKLPPEEAQYHMERCVASGLWVSNS